MYTDSTFCIDTVLDNKRGRVYILFNKREGKEKWPMKKELLELNNNLKSIFIHNPGDTFATIQIWFAAGSALEEKGEEGIAHFLEHMFFKGTKTRPGAQIPLDVESFGGEINAFTSFDYTCYYINAPKTKILKSTEILMDMVSHPLFKMEDIIPEREVVLEEYKRSLDSPANYSFQCLQKKSFKGGYAHPILGTPKTIKNFSRKQLTSFRTRFYNQQNAMLLVAGDIEDIRPKLIREIQKYKLPKGQGSTFPPFQLKGKSTLELHIKDVELAQLSLAISAPPLDKHIASAEDLAINCLGYGESSRLYKNLVRENALANSASSSTMFMSDGGVHLFKFYFPIEHLRKVLDKLEKTIETIYREGFQKNEIEKIKNQYIASKTFDLESLETYAFSIGNGFIQTGDLESESKFIERIKEHSLKEVNNSFKEIFKRPLHLSFQGPKDKGHKNAKEMLTHFQHKINRLFTPEKVKSSLTARIKKSSYDSAVKVLNIRPGIQLLYRQNLLTPTYTFHSYIKGGLSDESIKDNGRHNLLATLITKGYKKISEDKLKEDLEETSTSLSGFAGKNAYGLTMHGLTHQFPEMIDHFFGSLYEANFNKETLKRVKTLTLRNLENQHKDPIRKLFNTTNQLMFGDHPYSFNMSGTEKSIAKLSVEKIKSDHRKNLKEKDILFTYCGDLDLDEVLSNITPYLDQLAARKKHRPNDQIMHPLKETFKHVKLKREQTHLFIGLPTKAVKNKENIYLKMLSAHLSGQSSKLFVEVRDRLGLCYTAQPIHFMGLEGGYWGIYIACGNDKTVRAIAAIEKILDDIIENGLSAKEFTMIKKNIEGQALLNIQTNEDFAGLYSIPLLQGFGIDHFHKTNLAIQNLSNEKFKQELKKLKKREWKTVIVGQNID